MPDAAAIIDVRREGEQREVLTIHVVLQIEHARKTGARDLLLIPRSIGLLRTEQHLPSTIDVIDAPASIPRPVLVLSVDQILNGVADGPGLRIEPNVTEELECACGKVAARWIENRIVIGKRHVFQPWRGDILIKCGPTAIATLETKLPIQRASKRFIERLRIFRTNQPQRH